MPADQAARHHRERLPLLARRAWLLALLGSALGCAILVDLASGYAHDSRLAWQKDREFGLRIVRTHDLRGLAPASFQTAKRLWAAKAPTG